MVTEWSRSVLIERQTGLHALVDRGKRPGPRGPDQGTSSGSHGTPRKSVRVDGLLYSGNPSPDGFLIF